MQHKHRPPACFREDDEKCIAKRRKAMLMHTTTQSSICSTTSSAKSQNKRNGPNVSQNEDIVPASPPCAQPHSPKGNTEGNTSSQETKPELIEVSNGKSTDNDVTEVVEDNDNELGECEIEFGRSVN
jgi:hypothetical protein